MTLLLLLGAGAAPLPYVPVGTRLPQLLGINQARQPVLVGIIREKLPAIEGRVSKV